MSKGSIHPTSFVSKTPALYRRILYKGFTRYTSIESGKQTVEYETIAIVQAFFKEGDRYGLIPKYKLGYIKENGEMGLKLSLQPGPATSHRAVTQSVPLVATFPVADEAGAKIEGLFEQYEHSALGAVEMWSTNPWTHEMCWRYSGFWGMPVMRPIEEGNAIKNYIDGKTPLFVDGWGHKSGPHLVRTMSYSKIEDGNPVALFMRSSELEVVNIDEQAEEFDLFCG